MIISRLTTAFGLVRFGRLHDVVEADQTKPVRISAMLG